jgi:pilus assembly protein CpaF
MLQVEITSPDGRVRQVQAPPECTVGKGADNAIRLDSWRVGKEHARLFTTPAGVLLDDLGAFGGVLVNGERIEAQYGPLAPEDVIGIGPFKLRVTPLGVPGGLVQAAHPASRSSSAGQRNQLATEELQASRRAALAAQQKAQAEFDARRAEGEAPPRAPGFGMVLAPDPRIKQAEFEWRQKLHNRLIETMDLRRHDVSSMSDERLRVETEALIRGLLGELDASIPAELDRASLCRQVLDEAVGLARIFHEGGAAGRPG